jgi:hypothetical protein
VVEVLGQKEEGGLRLEDATVLVSMFLLLRSSDVLPKSESTGSPL